MRYLLDANVLVALAMTNHPDHGKAHAWFNRDTNRKWATCPLTQAGFLRGAFHSGGRSRAAIQTALDGLARNCQSPNHEFWFVDIDLRELADSQRTRIIGPNQVTDLQLLLLAHHRGGKLATFDSGIRELAAGSPLEKSLVLI